MARSFPGNGGGLPHLPHRSRGPAGQGSGEGHLRFQGDTGDGDVRHPGALQPRHGHGLRAAGPLRAALGPRGRAASRRGTGPGPAVHPPRVRVPRPARLPALHLYRSLHLGGAAHRPGRPGGAGSLADRGSGAGAGERGPRASHRDRAERGPGQLARALPGHGERTHQRPRPGAGGGRDPGGRPGMVGDHPEPRRARRGDPEHRAAREPGQRGAGLGCRGCARQLRGTSGLLPHQRSARGLVRGDPRNRRQHGARGGRGQGEGGAAGACGPGRDEHDPRLRRERGHQGAAHRPACQGADLRLRHLRGAALFLRSFRSAGSSS